MNQRFSEDLFLENATGKYLYNTFAKNIPVIDYHCHLITREIYENKPFEDLGEMWLAHDHYKWRAMRTFGIDERLITGDASYSEKFMAFAAVLPEMIGNPIYIWCALELKRFFGIDEPLCAENAERIYKYTKQLIIEKTMTPRWCMQMSNVEIVCTTEDPIDTLEYHFLLREDRTFTVRVISAFRPDQAMYCEKAAFQDYLPKLEAAAGMRITGFSDMISALDKRLEFFRSVETTISDCGLEYFQWCDYTQADVDTILKKARNGAVLTQQEINRFRTAFLLEMGRVYKHRGFVMQLHIGTYLDANSLGSATLGQAAGYDCMDDTSHIKSLGKLLDTLNSENMLPKMILYPLNGNNIEPYTVLAAAFCKGGTRALVQLGAPWWFNDQVYGIQRQFETAANLYPVSLSVGMLTDSRSFLSYPRHELYRRVFCNYLGALVERGEYFSGEEMLSSVIENVCYRNAKRFFEL